VTSWRQYSPAAAGVAIATIAMAKSPVPGAAVIFKSCFIVFSLVLASAPDDMGCRLRLRHQHRKKAKQFSLELNKRSKRPYRKRIKV
jgi:hypothetical protein